MILPEALPIAEDLVRQLEPHCERLEIAGSIRRRRPEVGDIEIVAIPKPYGVGLFESGIAKVVNQWPKVKGELPCLYTQRVLPQGIKLDLFFATVDNWGLQLAIRTGSADYSHHALAARWSRLGYRSANAILTRGDEVVQVREEEDLFRLIGLPWVPPDKREVFK